MEKVVALVTRENNFSLPVMQISNHLFFFLSEYSNQWYRSKQKYGSGSYNSHHDQTAPQVPGVYTGSPV